MNRRTKDAKKYNRKTYLRRTFRYRSDSELAECLAAYADGGELSFNMLVTDLLCEHFKCKIPHKRYNITRRITFHHPYKITPEVNAWR